MAKRRVVAGTQRAAEMATYPYPSPEMFLTIDTTLEAGLDYTLPLYGTVDVTVDWGDGSQDSYTTTGDKTHTYSGDGTYHIRISGTLTTFGSGAVVANIAKLTSCGSWGNLGLTLLNGAFRGASNIISVPNWLPSGVTSVRRTLQDATSFNDPAILTWGMDNIETIEYLFFGATSFDQPIGDSWNTPSLKSTYRSFWGATAFDQNMGSLDVTALTLAAEMFNNITLSTPNYDALLVGWESQAVNDNVSFHGGNSKYSPAPSDAATARQALIDDHGWTITDSGEDV